MMESEEGSALKLLIVEDNPGDRDLLEDHLDQLAIHVVHDSVDDLKSALDAVETNSYDIILLDLNLPDSEGPDSIARLHAVQAHVPILVLTGMDDDRYASQAIRAGAQDYIVKGEYSTAALARIIEYAIERQRQQTRLDQLNRVLGAIRNVNQLIVREKNQEEMARKACDMLLESGVYRTAWIILCHTDGTPENIVYSGDIALEGELAEVKRNKTLPACSQILLNSKDPVHLARPNELCSTCPLKPAFPDSRAFVCRLEHAGILLGYMGVSIPHQVVDLNEEKELFLEVSGDIAFALNASRLDLARKELETRYTRLFRAITSPLVIYEVHENGAVVIIDANPLAVQSAGLSYDAMIGHELADVMPDLARVGVVDAILDVNASRTPHDLPVMELTRANTSTWVEIHLFPLTPGQVGCVHDDVTETYLASRALQASEARFRSLFEHAPVGVSVADQQGRLVITNRALQEFLGYPSDYLARHSFREFTHEDDVSEDWQRFKRLLHGEIDHYSLEKRFRCRDGDVKYAVVGVTTVNSTQMDDRPIMKVVVDITERKHAEHALERNLHSLRQAERIANLGYTERDWRTGEGYWSQGFLRLLGLDPEDTGTHEDFLNYIVPDDRERVRQALQESRTKGGPLVITFRMQRADGTVIYVRGDGRTELDEQGNPLVIRGTFQDVTPWVEAQEELQRQKQALAQAQRVARLGSWQVDLQTNEIVWSEEMYHLTGQDPSMDPPDYEQQLSFVHPEDRDHYNAVVQEAIAAGQGYDIRFRIHLPEESERWMHSRCEIVLDNEGTPTHLIGTGQDITEQIKAGEALADSEKQLRQAQRVARVGSWVWNLSTDELQWSDEMYRIFGLERDSFSGYLPDVIERTIHPEDLERVRAALRELTESGEPVRQEYRVVHEDGTVRHVLTEVGEEIPGREGKPKRLTGIVMDITGRKQAEQEQKRLTEQLHQAQKMESVGRLAGGVAHDFNNMLQTILGNCEIAMTDPNLDAELKELLEEIELAADRSANLTRQLLAFARKQTIEPRVIDLNEHVATTLKMLQRLIGENIRLVWIPSNELWSVRIDPTQLDQVLANLAVNARDAIDESGTITVETANTSLDESYFKTHSEVRPGDYIMLSVSDDGRGMDREVLNRAFEPFFTTKKQGEGTGLGLATIYGIVKQNEGLVNIYSEPGEGTTFKLYLPRAREAAFITAGQDRARQLPGGQETILIVEDEVSIIRMGSRILERLGYTVLSTSDCREALAILRERADAIDLLITDVIMPEMNGRELAEQMHEIKPDLVVLFMSGYTENVIANRGVLKEGVNFIQKPFTSTDLANKVRGVLGG